MTVRPSNPTAHVDAVLNPEYRVTLITGTDGLPPRVPGRYFRGGHSAGGWKALTNAERESILDRLAPMDADPDVLLALAAAALASDAPASTPRRDSTRTRTTSPASTMAGHHARVLAPAPALHTDPTQPSGETQADATAPQLTG